MIRRIAKDVDYRLIVGAVVALILTVTPLGAFSVFTGVCAGALVTVAASQFYSRQASRELRREAAALREESRNLRQHTTLILRGLEEAGLAKYNRDDQGEFEGMHLERHVTDAVNISDTTVKREVHRREDNTDAPGDQE